MAEWISVRCHLCGKYKEALDEERALYLLAFHYDRRHKGWTHAEWRHTTEAPTESRPAPDEPPIAGVPTMNLLED